MIHEHDEAFDFDDSGDTCDLPDDTTQVWCPYCGAEVELLLDPGGGSVQAYVEDCEVCCRPWHLKVQWDPSGHVWVEVRTEEE
jgi:hypothetical protein